MKLQKKFILIFYYFVRGLYSVAGISKLLFISESLMLLWINAVVFQLLFPVLLRHGKLYPVFGLNWLLQLYIFCCQNIISFNFFCWTSTIFRYHCEILWNKRTAFCYFPIRIIRLQVSMCSKGIVTFLLWILQNQLIYILCQYFIGLSLLPHRLHI